MFYVKRKGSGESAYSLLADAISSLISCNDPINQLTATLINMMYFVHLMSKCSVNLAAANLLRPRFSASKSGCCFCSTKNRLRIYCIHLLWSTQPLVHLLLNSFLPG